MKTAIVAISYKKSLYLLKTSNGFEEGKKTQEKGINVLFLLCELSTCHYVTFAKGLFTHYVTSSKPEGKENREKRKSL